MKKRNYKKYIFDIVIYLYIAVQWFIYVFVYEISGKYALFSKGFKTLSLLLIGVLFIISAVTKLKSRKVSRLRKLDIFLISVLILASAYFLLQSVKYIPAISADLLEGKHSTLFEISDQSHYERKWIRHKYYLSGTASDGKEMTFEVSDTDFYDITHHAKKVEIEYWKHCGIISSWSTVKEAP